MKINVKEIKGHLGDSLDVELVSEIEAKKINGQLVKFPEPLEINLQVINADGEYALLGKIKFSARKPCSRCLKDVDFSKEIDFNAEIARSKVENDIIDISKYVIEHLRLAVPMQVVCDEECKGLCPGCGINLNKDDCDCMMHKVDPRLAKLENLLDK